MKYVWSLQSNIFLGQINSPESTQMVRYHKKQTKKPSKLKSLLTKCLLQAGELHLENSSLWKELTLRKRKIHVPKKGKHVETKEFQDATQVLGYSYGLLLSNQWLGLMIFKAFSNLNDSTNFVNMVLMTGCSEKERAQVWKFYLSAMNGFTESISLGWCCMNYRRETESDEFQNTCKHDGLVASDIRLFLGRR